MMPKNDCGMLSDLLKWPEDLLVLRGRDDDDEDKDDKDSKGSAASGEGAGDGSKGDGETLTPEQIADLQRKIANFDEERDRIQKRRKDAEKSASDLQAQLDELTRKGVNDDEIKKQIDDLTSVNNALQAQVNDQALQLAFFKSNKHEWQNNAAALKLLDMSDVEIDKDGNVDGLDAALDKLAREHAYLIKPKDGKGEKKDPPKTGETPRNRGDNDSKSQAATEARLRAKYPALRRR